MRRATPDDDDEHCVYAIALWLFESAGISTPAAVASAVSWRVWCYSIE